jgi:hypothetical protein
MLFTVLPLIFIPLIVLSYYSLSIRTKSPPHAVRSAWLALAVLLVILSYIPEVIGLPVEFGGPSIINFFRILYAVAAILFYISFTRFFELQWPTKIRDLYLCLDGSGICLFHHSFKPKEVEMSASLVGGFITGLTSLIQEITQTDKHLKVVNVEDIQIILEYGNHKVIGILMTEGYFPVLPRKLKQLITQFEAQFQEKLTQFSGAVHQFEPTKALVKEIFTYQDIF